jgi:hypothetical protein
MASGEPKTFVAANERVLILMLCGVAALRVFIFPAAFPFFSNIDEDLHFDLITQYSQARIPHGFDRLKEETLNCIVPYASPEFLFPPERFPDGKFPAPLWKEPWSKVEPEIAATRAAWSSEINFESSQPPLYYVLASLWWWVGKHIGFVGIEALYWIRFLNVAFMALMVWLGYVAARAIAPERVDLRIGVPLLLAFIPQNVFYAMNNDVLSPLSFGLLFLCVLQWLRTDAPMLRLGVLTGFALAVTYLTKLSNLPLISVAFIIIVAKLGPITRRTPRAGLIVITALILCATVPIGAWVLWTKFHFGDITGSATKIRLLGWTRKPLADWSQHPIFTLHGVWSFWSELIASFWRGEVSWHGQPLRWPGVDEFYALSSLLVAAAAIAGLRKLDGLSVFQRQANWERNLDFFGRRCVSRTALDSIRFRRLYKPVTATSLFHFRPIAKRRTDSVCCSLCVWRLLGVSSNQHRFGSHGVRINRRVRDNLGDFREPDGFRERAQLVSPLIFLHLIECDLRLHDAAFPR